MPADISETAELSRLVLHAHARHSPRMTSAASQLAVVAACAGDPARANMLSTLMDGRAFTAGELASVAGVTPQTASGHLARMTEAGLLTVARQGRHRYYRLASPRVAQMLEGMLVLAGEARPPEKFGPRTAAMRLARTCYDHFAGRLGVAIADRLVAAGHVALSDDGGTVTPDGRAFFARIGIALDARPGARRVCRPCLDWSERRYHLGGALGARIAEAGFALGWVRRRPRDRAVDITPLGRRMFHEVYGVRLEDGR